jgi:hypothetical protein
MKQKLKRQEQNYYAFKLNHPLLKQQVKLLLKQKLELKQLK